MSAAFPGRFLDAHGETVNRAWRERLAAAKWSSRLPTTRGTRRARAACGTAAVVAAELIIILAFGALRHHGA